MPSSRRRFLKATGVVGTGLVAGCSTDPPGEQTETPTDASGDGDDGGTTDTPTSDGNGGGGDEIRIGVLSPLSGGYSVLGEPQAEAAELAAKQLNENGGIDGRDVVVIQEDTGGEPSTARQKAERLVNSENVDILTGEANSAAGLSIQEFAAENEIVFGSQVGADPVTKARCNRYTFRYELRTGQVARAVAPWAVQNLGGKVWFHVADYAYGNAFLEGWKSVLENSDLDFEEVNTTKSELGANDYSSYITSMQNSDADFVALGMAGGDLVRFNQQASSYNLRESVDVVAGTNDFLSVRQGGGQGVVGTYSGVRYNEAADNDLNRQFVSGYIDEFDAVPQNHAESQWTMIHEILAPAIEEAGSTDADDLIPVLEGMEFESPMGGGTLRECDHQAARPVGVAKISEPRDSDVLQGRGGEFPSLDVVETIGADDAIEPCGETGCSL